MEQQTTIWKHSRILRHTDTWLWVIQALTAMIILIMGSIHMWTVLSTLPITAAKSAARIQGGFWFIFYLILLPMVELHVGIGFYRIAVKWGLIRRKTRKGFKKFENILTGIFILIGLITIIRFLTLPI
jgi:fumarate reductase subunit C